MAVNFPSNPTNGQTITVSGITYAYDSTQGVWSDNPQGLTQAIDALTDVDTSTNASSTGDLLQWNGTNWVPYTHTNGITEIDQWRVTANITTDQAPLSSNIERVDNAVFSNLGTGMSVSSGIWTFPSTGLYEITVFLQGYCSATDPALVITTHVSTDGGSNWDIYGQAAAGRSSATGNVFVEGTSQNIFNVTNTTNVKLKFEATSIASGNYVRGNTDWNQTHFTFKRLGDSQ